MKAPHDETRNLRHELADRLVASGDLRTRPWRDAVEAVPREEFLPGFFRPIGIIDGRLHWESITRDRHGPGAVLDAAYGDDSAVTQLDGVLTPFEADGPVTGTPTSSATMPGLVVRMWEDLLVDDGMDVAEVGTGTGYSTALACHRLGSGHVTSIDVDPAIVEHARASLVRVGFTPTLFACDALAGLGPAARRYDRVIAACSVRRIPDPWIAQTRPGGIVLAVLTGRLGAYALARLRVHGDGTAEGAFIPGTASFMPARAHAIPPHGFDLSNRADGSRSTPIGPEVIDDRIGRFVAQLAVPTVEHFRTTDEDGSRADYLIDTSTGGHAILTTESDGKAVVREAGPGGLWDPIEHAIAAWRDAGSPDVDGFGIRTHGETHMVRLKDTAQPTEWELPPIDLP